MCCGVVMVWGVEASDRFRGLVVLDEVLDSVAYDVGVCSESLDFVMYVCHEVCIRVIF